MEGQLVQTVTQDKVHRVVWGYMESQIMLMEMRKIPLLKNRALMNYDEDARYST